MRKALLVVLILSSALAWAQGGCTGQKPLNGMTTGGFLKGVANASVRVCSDTLTPCTTIPLYSDAALTQSIANPVTTDATGNYQYCAASGSYNEQISGSAFSTVNNTPVTISGSGDVVSSGNNTFTGTNTHSGTETFTGNLLAATFRGEWSAWLTGGTDVCDSTVKTASAMVAAGLRGGRIDSATGYSGTQPCANGLNGYPYSLTLAPAFESRVRFADDAIVQTNVTFVIPGHTTVSFGLTHGNYFGAGSSANAGGWIVPSATFSGTNTVELGYLATTQAAIPQGARLENAGVSCIQPNGTSILNSIGILNQHAQERSGWTNVHISGCTTAFDIENGDTLGGSQNAGPYENTSVSMDGVSDIATAGTGFKIGTNGTGSSAVHVGQIRNLWISCVNSFGRCPRMGYIDAHDVQMDGMVKLEQGSDGILVGSVHNVGGLYINNLLGTQSATNTMGSLVELSATTSCRGCEFHNLGTNNPGTLTNFILDHLTNGKTITAISQGSAGSPTSMGAYLRGGSDNQVWSNAAGVVNSTSLNTLTTPTANLTLGMNGFAWTIQSSAAQSASPLTVAGIAGNTNSYAVFSAFTQGTNERPFNFSIPSVAAFTMAHSGQLQHTTSVVATSGANANCPGSMEQGNWWNGASSASENFTWGCTFGTGANPTVTGSITHTGGGTGVHLWDWTGWRLLSTDIRTNTASNTDLAGTIAISASTTGTYTFAQTYASAPICTLTPTADPTATGVYWATATTTVLTANVKTSGTITFNYQCVGRN